MERKKIRTVNNHDSIVTSLIASIAVLPVVELFFYLPVISRVSDLSLTARKATAVLSSRNISEHWKETAIQCYAREIMRLSLLLLFYLLLMCVVFVLLFAGLSLLAGRPFAASVDTLMSFEAQIAALCMALIYGVWRKRMIKNV